MTKREAFKRADRKNSTQFANSRIKLKPVKFGGTWVLVGVPRIQAE